MILIVLLLLMKMIYAQNLRVDSDESQHIHVVWAWANGLMQYRDVADNHAPLFQMLYSYIYRMFGERQDIVVLMRLSVIPLFIASLYAIYKIGQALYSRSSGLWAAIYSGLYPHFLLTSTEFRTDDLWMLLWFAALAVLVSRPAHRINIIFFGLLIGACFSVSMKSILLISGFGAACITVCLVFHVDIRKKSGDIVAFLLSSLLVPSALGIYFYAHGAFTSMIYGVFQHNMTHDLGRWHHPLAMALPAAGFLVFGVLGSALLLRSKGSSAVVHLRLIVFLTFSIAMALLYGTWPLITPEDFLPLTPLLIITITGFARDNISVNWRGLAHNEPLKIGLLIFPVILEIIKLIHGENIRMNETSREAQMLSQVLRLTQPEDTLMDLKGETIFRSRPFYYQLEGITRKRIRNGEIKDSIPEDMLRHGTTVAALDNTNFPSRGRLFLNRNFIPIGMLRVAGQFLPPFTENGPLFAVIRIQVPTTYALVSETEIGRAWIDGKPYITAVRLETGQHRIEFAAKPRGHIALLWAPAIERGFSPFNNI